MLAKMEAPERERERSKRKLRAESSRKSLATAATGFSTIEEKLENAAMHPRVKWYLSKLTMQKMCETVGLENRVIGMQRTWRKFYYSKMAAGTLRSMQVPTHAMVPQMMLTLTQQIANLRRYMEEAGLIKEDNSAAVLADVAGRSFKLLHSENNNGGGAKEDAKPKGSKSFDSERRKSSFALSLVNTLTSAISVKSSGGEDISSLLSPKKSLAGGMGGGKSIGGGGGGGVQLSLAQFEELKIDLRSIVREELKAAMG